MLAITLFLNVFTMGFASDLIITGIIDGSLAGGTPKAIELYVLNDITDLSQYAVSSASNGNPPPATYDFVFPNVAVAAGTYLYLSTETLQFMAFFGFAPDYTDGQATNVNGDDTVVLYRAGVIVDVFGVVGTDGTGEAWEHTNGWAYRNDITMPSATFDPADWTFSGVDALNGETDNTTAAVAFPTGQWTAATLVNRPIINPEPDVQIRNGATLAAAVITSNAPPYHYGTTKRGETVVLDYLVRNTGKQVLELGDLTLPPFLSLSSEPLPETLASFASAPLSLQVDTSTPGQLSGEITLTSNDPNGFENPFVFTVRLQVSDTPANALYILPGVTLADRKVSAGSSAAVLSLQLFVPAGSSNVSLDALTIRADSVPALGQVQRLGLYIDGGLRGERDRFDVPLATWLPPADLTDSITDSITFEFPVRTLEPDLPLWLLIVADF